MVELVHLVAQLRGDVVTKPEAASMWQARAELLALQLQQAQDRIRALEAPREPTPVENAPGGPTDGLTFETAQGATPPKRSWWRRAWSVLGS